VSDPDDHGEDPTAGEPAPEADHGEDPTAGEPAPEADPGGGEQGDSRLDVERVATYLRRGGILALGVLAVVAAAGLYGSLSAIIDVWVADRYQPFARAMFNFGVLCVAAAGIVVLLRRE